MPKNLGEIPPKTLRSCCPSHLHYDTAVAYRDEAREHLVCALEKLAQHDNTGSIEDARVAYLNLIAFQGRMKLVDPDVVLSCAGGESCVGPTKEGI